MRAVPVIIPVTFTLFGEDLVFSPGSGPDEARAVADSVVAFETDAIGPDGGAVWDVHVTGVARTLTPAIEPQRFRLSSEFISGWQTASYIDMGHRSAKTVRE